MSVFDLHGGVIHQNADSKSQAAQSHHVNRLPKKTQNAERGKNGERDGDANNQRAAPTAQKQQDHHARERGSDERFAYDSLRWMRARTWIDRPRADHFEIRGKVGEDLGKRGLHGIDDGEGGSFAVSGNGDQNAARAIGANDVVLDLKAVMNLGHVFHVNGRAVYCLDGQIIQIVQDDGTAVDANLIFGAGEFRGAGGKNQVLQVQGVRDIERRKLLGIELIEVEVHHDGALFSAERIGNRSALHGA